MARITTAREFSEEELRKIGIRWVIRLQEQANRVRRSRGV